ncbi:hypothetical protein PVAND_003325 [Polypedilum vanderplanki]|uniref:non-specific serine/threonine protein kinase n=1 Tax=Polypedilum vanderplanki TaxID=319348 RepID=A0A9J6BVG4_POLVA|nr:hypothetical protein PVAND_003325 [Polypedilum vanderplanki]
MSAKDFIKTQLEALRNAKRNKNPSQCLQIIDVLSDYFDIPKSSTEIKYAIELLLKENDKKIDITKFLITSITTKIFHDCAAKVLELIQKVTILHSPFVKPFTKNLIDVCIQIIKCAEPSARFKEMAVKSIDEIISRGALMDEERDEKIKVLIKTLLSVFDQSLKNRLFNNTFEVLGKISKMFPDKFTPENARKFLDKMLTVIQNLFKDDKASTSLILVSGAVDGLKNHLANFTPTENEDEQFKRRFYECMILLSDPFKHGANSNINTESNRVPFRNMLAVVNLYGHLVSEFIFEDHLKWHNILQKWISSKNYEDKNAGVLAIQTVHIEIAKNIEKRKNDEDKSILLFYMNHFQKTLESPNSETHEIRIAIKGFGYMAGSAKILLEPKYLNDRFDLVMQRTEYSYFVGNKMKRREVLEHLPNYVEALSKIISQIDEISGIQLQSLQSIMIILIKDFHFLSTSHHNLVANGLFETFINLEKMGGKIFNDIVESIIWQGILWTCSHQLKYDLENNYENIKDWKETITYVRYLPLWKRLLNPTDENHKRIGSTIYEHFIKNLFQIIDKLDLSTRKRKYFDESSNTDVEFFFTDISLDLEAVRPENFQILYNLTQFYSDLIIQQSNEELEEKFSEWIELWLEKSIFLALKNPLVSAFMYLIEIALKIMERLDFIKKNNHDNSFMESKLVATLKSYIKLLFSRAKQVSHELQIACLQLIFQAPIDILKEYIEEFISILILGFTIGKNIVNLAHHSLTCYEKIVNEYNNDPKKRRVLLEKVLPCLESFLSSGKELSTDSELKELKYKRQRKRMILQSIETDLVRLKKRILLFLGTCTPEESQLILSNFQPKLTREYITNIFNVTLHSDDELNALIYLDQIIERVCYIALHSSDRSIKISGCELLHGMVLYMMGKNLKETETLPIWKDLCRNIIILGAEKDQTIRALFEPLLMQMMHFYSKPDQILNPLSTVLIEAVLEMISYRDNTIQDLSARLLREYILWLMRQTNKEQRKLAPITLVDFFQELKKMSIETEQSRRIGATLAFNNIYRIIREEESLIDIYWIYLLDVFCLNFRNTEDFSNHLDNCFVDDRRFEQVSSSLDHITRVFIERSDIFNHSNKDRIKPFGFDGVMFNDILNWIFKQCIMQQFFYRQKCMQIFLKMVPEKESKRKYFESNWTIKTIINLSEVQTTIVQKPDLSFLKGTTEPIYKETYNWMENFLRLLDFYHWLLKNELIEKDIDALLNSSIIRHSINYFLSNVVVNDLNTLVRSIDENLINSTQMSYEAKMYNRNVDKIYVIRNATMIKILDFLEVLMKQYSLEKLLNKNYLMLLKMIKNLIFNPQKLSFDYKSKGVINNLNNQILQFIETASKHSKALHNKLLKLLENKTFKHMSNFSTSLETYLKNNVIDEIQESKLSGLDILFSNFKKQMNIKRIEDIARDLLKKLFNGLVEENIEIHQPRSFKPSVKKFINNIMKVCLKVNSFLDELILFILDDTPLKITGMCKITKGENFIQIFKHPVFQTFTMQNQHVVTQLASKLDDSTSNNLRIFNILTDINEFIYKYYNNRSDLLNENIHTMVSIWPTIMKTINNMNNDLNCVDMAIINLITHIAMVCPYELHLLCQRLEDFLKWLLGIFENKENSLEIKSKAVFLLPCITHSEDKNNDELMKALNKIRQHHLPLRSMEFPDGSIQKSSFVVFTNALFQALLTSKSPIIYKFIIQITINDEKYMLEDKLQNVQKKLMENLSEKEQETFLLQTFDTFLDESIDPEIRLTIVSRYLLTIMKNCLVETMLAFIRQKIGQIWQLIDSNFDFDPASGFVNRSGGYLIIEAFVAAVPKEKIESATYSYGGNLNNGLTFIKEFIMKAKDVRRDVVFVVDDPALQEIFRKFQCYCYRALAAMVANTKDLPEVFNLCLFQENPRTRSFIWRKIINVLDDNLYSNWSQEFNDFPKVKEYIVSIKEMDVNTANKQNKYIEKTSIFDRSLSQTLTKTDLSYSVVLSNREMLENDQRNNEKQKQMRINLESLPINDHEVMGAICAVINTIFTRKFSIFSNFDNADRKKYEWVISIANSLISNDQHKNVKLFLAKLIDNCRNVFSHYAEFLLEPLLTILTDGSLGFNSMNFFITDITTMLISWSHIYKPKKFEEKECSGLLLKFLMTNAYHEKNEIFKMNLELIKRVVESWKDVLAGKIPTQILLEMLNNDNVKLICGIQLNAVILANDLVPWNTDEQCEMFLKAILNSFDKENEKIYQAAAQLCGLYLNTINNENYTIIVRNKMEKFGSRKDKTNLFLQLLYGIQKSFPSILDTFMNRIVQSITPAIRKIKCMYLEMFLSRMEIFQTNVHRELTVIKIKDLLKQSEFQVLSLHILNKSLEYLTSAQFFTFYDELNYLVNSANSEVRNIIYEIMIYSIEKFAIDADFDKKKPLKLILKGFEDTNPEIQNRVIKFFNDNSGLSTKLVVRFDELLSGYYDVKLEDQFLHYATQLLLQISVKHNRSKRKLLDYDQRNDINFFEVPITTKSSYSQKNLPPMFIGSQHLKLLAGDGSQYSQMIRATQLNSNNHRMFEPTQNPEIIEQVPQTFKFNQTQNSLLVTLKPQYLDRRSSFTSQNPDDDNFELQIQKNKEEKLNADSSLDYLRRRIVNKTENQRSKDYALRAVDRRDFVEASTHDKIQQLKQGKDPVLYRRYRVGDFPDFFFNSLAILLPLQALVKKDVVIARHIFISIFTALAAIFRENNDFESEKNFYSSINTSVMNVLKNSKESNSYLLAVLVEMAIKSEKYLEISPETLNDSLSITGILFAESQIIHLNQFLTNENDDEIRNKRVRLDENDIKLQHWIRLIDFYHKINELEVVNGILEDKLNLDEQVKISLLKAIKCESNNSFKEAMSLYSNLLQNNIARNNSEKDLYYNSYFNCLANLNDWDLITETAQSQFNSYEEIWDEKIPFYQNTVLPMLLKGELRKIIDGNTNDGFISVIEEWLNDDKKSEYLQRKFPEEIAMLNIMDENYTACCVELDKTLNTVSNEWSYLEMYEEKIRLLSLSRNLAELSNFVNIMAVTSIDAYTEKQIQKLYQSWRVSMPKSSDSLIVWNDLLAYRKTFLSLMLPKFNISDEQRQLCESFLIDSERNLLEVSFKQRNIDTAKVLIQILHKELQDSTTENVLKYNLAFGKYIMMIAERESVSSFTKGIKRYGNAWDSIINGVLNDIGTNFDDIKIETLCCVSQISLNLMKLYQKLDNDNEVAGYKSGFMELMNVIDENAELKQSLLEYSVRALQNARDIAQESLNIDYSPEKENQLGEIYFKLGQYYRFVFAEKIAISKSVQLEMIKSIFRAIFYGQDNAKIYIPYIISQLPVLTKNQITTEFNKQLNMVPEWIFIPYISHILSNFDFENDCYLDQLILNLAKKYPNALYYPFKLSRDNFYHVNESQVMEKALVNEINNIVSIPIMERFTSALQCLVIPEKLVEIHFQNFCDEVVERRIDNSKYQEKIQNMFDKIFKHNNDMKGSDFSKIQRTYYKLIVELKKFNWDTEKEKAYKQIREIQKTIRNGTRIQQSQTVELNKLCQWLAEYKWSGNEDFIEIPGQYKGNIKPFIENHVKIVRFETRLDVFNSKQLPIKVGIYGSDGKIYNFIVKYGEDLRQDQRIQEVMDLMSSKLTLDKNCRKNRLKIDTYQVIPINSTCGLLQMVTNTATISEFMQKSGKSFLQKDFNEYVLEARNKFRELLLAGNKFTGWIETFEKALITHSRDRLIEIFEEISNQVPLNIIQKSLTGLSLTLHSYYILRKNFVTSLAAMNVTHWLLGIGDRHLNNILINTSNARLIAIDFGIAFGTAASLGIAELIPFRLTPHFVSVLYPMEINGLLKENMNHTLKCYRDHRETIVVCLEVFVKEPTLDWLKETKKKSIGSINVENESVASSTWEPESRIDIVKRKLNGHNPTKILIEELNSGHVGSKREIFNAYKNLIYGEENCTRYKYQHEELNLRTEDQIECLIEIATDKAVLATTYVGWDSWF